MRDWPEIQKLEIPPSEVCSISGDWEKLGIPNLARMSNEMLLNAAKWQRNSFYRFWVITGKNYAPLNQIKVKANYNLVYLNENSYIPRSILKQLKNILQISYQKHPDTRRITFTLRITLQDALRSASFNIDLNCTFQGEMWMFLRCIVPYSRKKITKKKFPTI